MGSQKPTPLVLTILAIIGSLVTVSISLDIPITNPFANPPTPIPAPSPTLIPTSTPQWNIWLETEKQIPYKELFRYAESYVGEKFYFRARIIQAIENDGDFALLAYVAPVNTILRNDMIRIHYNNAPVRVLVDDVVHFVGIMEGLYTFHSSRGDDITVPSITVLKLIIE